MTALRVSITRRPGSQGLPLPSPATEGAAGLDLAAAVPEGEPLEVGPGQRVLVPTGLVIAVPEGYEAQVRPRSGLALRHGILLPNAPGTIDSDYRGEIQVILLNTGKEPFSIRRGDRIAQLVFAPVVRTEWREVDDLDSTERGEGAFGHTGSGSAARDAAVPRGPQGEEDPRT